MTAVFIYVFFVSFKLSLKTKVLNHDEKKRVDPNKMLVLAPSITPKTIAWNNGINNRNFDFVDIFFWPNNNPPNRFAG